MISLFAHRKRSQRGSALAEYALALAAIALLSVAGVKILGIQIGSELVAANQRIKCASTSAAGGGSIATITTECDPTHGIIPPSWWAGTEPPSPPPPPTFLEE